VISVDDLIALRELPGVGERTVARLIERQLSGGPTLREILAAPAAELRQHRLPESAIARLRDRRRQHFDRCRGVNAELARAGGLAMAIDDALFPERLMALEHPPPLLFLAGNSSLLRRPMVSVLLSRTIERHTLGGLQWIAQTAAAAGCVLATGGMKSSHRLAAIAGRAHGCRRIVVLDRGLLTTFAGDPTRDPFGCGPRKARLDRRRSLVLSPFRPHDHATAGHGRRRDQLIESLGEVVFVPSLRPGGEVERLCLHSLRRGKPVLTWVTETPSLRHAGARRVDAEILEAGIGGLFEGD